MGHVQLYLLAAVAGFTIYLGLPVALIPRLSPKINAFLNALSVGVLIFLLVEVTGKAIGTVAGAMIDSNIGRLPWSDGLGYLVLLICGFSTGLLSLVGFEKYYIRRREGLDARQQAVHIATMIAVGIGLHNFSEGLAIGQSAHAGEIELATVPIIGFGLHNATEGFGIAGPLCGQQPSAAMLGVMGLIGGGPTFVGTLVGSIWSSKPVETLCLALASGSILYVVAELVHLGKRKGVHEILMAGLIVGFFVGFVSEMIIDMNSPEAGEYGTTVAKAGPAVPPSVSAGKAVFQQNCAICHGVNADGKSEMAQHLPIKPADFRDLTFDATENNWDWYDAITYGRSGVMPAWQDKLTPADRWNVIAYIRSLNVRP